MKPRLLLINPALAGASTTPFYVMPPGILSLAGYMRDRDVEVDIADINVLESVPSLNEYLSKHSYSLVGVSVMVAGQFKQAREILRLVKRFSPTITTMIGGAHSSQFPTRILDNCPEVDFVVIGEGEIQLIDISVFASTKDLADIHSDGVAFRTAEEIIVRPKTSFIEDLNSLPLPAYDLVNFDDYALDTSTWHNPYQISFGTRVPLITSRGCPYQCNFCSVSKCMGQRYRPMDSVRVADMIEKICTDQNASYFAIYDANFTQDAKRVIDICNEISKRDLKIVLDLPTGLPLNRTSRDIVDALVGIGLIRTCVSIESGDYYIRNDVMRKNIEQDDIHDIIDHIRQYLQVFLLVDFIIGMPEDTRESLDASYRTVNEIDVDDITLSVATPYLGTALYEQCVKDKLFFDMADLDRLWDAEWFNHENTDKFVIKPYRLDLETLTAYRDKILAVKREKIRGYHDRMRRVFGIESSYRKSLL